MSDPSRPDVGSIGWFDLTVPDAAGVRDFYREVAGWTSTEVDMGGYADYLMHRADGTAVAGVCHDRGPNEGLPLQWLAYVTVADVDHSSAQVERLGGAVLRPVTAMGGMGRYAIVRDPAGAVLALFQPE